MFNGIIESTSVVRDCQERSKALHLKLKKPKDFNDLDSGDSVAVDGVCLTVEEQASDQMTFTLAAETLHVTGWSAQSLFGRKLNLERSLRYGDRIHGHLVYGHVDCMGQIWMSEGHGSSWILEVGFPMEWRRFLWPKGSVAINGVSLTVNQVGEQSLRVCLIPETLNRTNLGDLTEGDEVTLEMDNMARGLIHWLDENQQRS